ncbi:MAG: hypothetical protein WBE26_06010 [Phycisphaerae bacterium]
MLGRLGGIASRGGGRKLTAYRHYLGVRAAAIIGLSLSGAVAAAGCGNAFGKGSDDSASRPLYVTECGGDSGVARVATDLIVLDWRGGWIPLYPHEEFEPLDLSVFETAEGGTLADDAELFKELVRLQIIRIYCDSPAPGIVVHHAADAEDVGGNTVYFTQMLSPNGDNQIGEGEYDPCNRQHDNAAVLFGEQIRRLGRLFTFDEWVLVFANVAAHEIGHMLGYGHVTRDELPETGRAIFVELMLDGHMIDELRMEQRFIVEQTNCPDEPCTARRRIEDPTFICGIERGE